jgi:RimJ/RimL family protein N-acetyltransferase
LNYPETFPLLHTPRLALRGVERRDVPEIFELESDPIAMRFWSRLPMTDLSEAEEQVERSMRYFANRDGIKWVLTRPDEDRLLGHASIFSFSEQSGRADIGYGLMRQHWGQGLMHEALTAIVDYAFGPLGLRRLEADVHPDNAASLRSVERLGFTREGFLRERWQVGETISDSVVFGLLAREWRARREAT